MNLEDGQEKDYQNISKKKQELNYKLSKSQISKILAKEKYVYIWGKYSLEDKQDKKKERNSKKN